MFLGKLSIIFFLASNSFKWSSSCGFDTKITQMLLGKGFHRNLTYTIEILKKWTMPLHESCILSLEQPVPAGLYANPDELFELTQAGKLAALLRDHVDVELPAEKAAPSTVYVMQTLDTLEAQWLSLWVPLHARYHKAVRGGGHATVKIPPPKLFMTCEPVDALMSFCGKPSKAEWSGHCSSKGFCEWIPVEITCMTDAPVWSVPVGDFDHWHLVAFVTSLAYLGCTLYILRELHRYKRFSFYPK